MIFSGEFDHSQTSAANCVVNVFQCDIRSRSKYVLYTLSSVMMQNSCFKVIFIPLGVKNYSLLPYFDQVFFLLKFYVWVRIKGIILLKWLFTVIGWFLKANYTVLLNENVIILLCSHCSSFLLLIYTIPQFSTTLYFICKGCFHCSFRYK